MVRYNSLFYYRNTRFLSTVIIIIILATLPLYANSYVIFISAIELLYAMVVTGYDILLSYTG